MTRLTRRKAVLAGASTGLAALAGCSSLTGGGLPTDLERTNGAVAVDLDAATEAGFTRSNHGLHVDFGPDVGASFVTHTYYDGTHVENPATADGLQANRVLTAGSTPTAYVAPVYRSEQKGFEYRLYANEAFRTMADWHVLVGVESAERETSSRSASFESHGPVWRDVLEPSSMDVDPTLPVGVALANYPVEEIGENAPSDLAAVLLHPTGSKPEASFAISFDENTVTITHRGGDVVDGDQLQLYVGSDRLRVDFPDTFETGESITVDLGDAPENADVTLRWRSPDGDLVTLATAER